MLNKFKTLLLNTLFPPVCVSCKTEGDFLCADCIKNLNKKKISPVYHEKQEDPDLHYLDGVIYALDYAKNPQIKAAIKQLKYKFTQDLAEHFADIIAKKVRELNMVKNKKIILIPVPLHKKRLNYRGFNQAEVIARAVTSKFSDNQMQVVELLERVRHTDQQAKLDKYERRKNLGGAFVISSDSREMNTKFVHSSPDKVGIGMTNYDQSTIYFIVDDVCTTASTLEECAGILKGNGFEKVYGLVIARAFK